MKTNVTVTAASLTLTHCTEKVNTTLQSVSESQIQFDCTRKASVFDSANNIPLREFINILMMMVMIINFVPNVL
jgi:hypothetical protein